MPVAGVPLVQSDLELADSKRLADSHLALSTLVVSAPGLVFRRPHDEATRWHDDHLAAARTFLERIAGLQCLLGLRGQHGVCDIPEHFRRVIDHPCEHGQQREKEDSGKNDERSPPQSLPSQCLAT